MQKILSINRLCTILNDYISSLSLYIDIEAIFRTIKGVHHQIQSTAPGTEDQGRRIGPVQQLPFTLNEHQVQRQRQEGNQGDAGDQRERSRIAETQILPGDFWEK